MTQIDKKTEFYEAIAKKTGFKQKDVEKFYTGLLDVVHEVANSQDETHIHFPHLGRLNIRVVDAHMGINPKTQTRLLVSSSRRTHFKVFPQFTKSVNKTNKHEQ